MRPKTEHPKAGEPIRYAIRKGGFALVRTVCCDCKLVHLEEFTPRKTYIRVRVWRDDKLTEMLRKRKRERRS